MADRFLLDTALCLVWGGGGFAMLTPKSIRERLLTKMRLPLLACAIVGVAAAAAALPLQAAELASGWTSVAQAGLLATVTLQTDVGISTVVEAAVAAALAAAALSGRHRVAVCCAFWLSA